jgi:hypothetical protein
VPEACLGLSFCRVRLRLINARCMQRPAYPSSCKTPYWFDMLKSRTGVLIHPTNPCSEDPDEHSGDCDISDS